MSSNPVFSRIEREAEHGYAGFRDRGAQPPQPAQPSTAGWAATDQLSTQQLEQMYQQQPASPVQMGRVTLDDVVMKTLGLFSLVLVFGAVGWVLTPQLGPVLWMGGIALTLVLGLVIAFKKTISVPLIVSYAVVEGVLVGSVSHYYSVAFDAPRTPVFEGIVAQAVLATLSVFVGMFIAYRVGLIKVTSKFRRIVTMALFGYVIFAVINLVYALVAGVPFGIGGTGALGIGLSLFAVGLASLCLALDFDSIEYAIKAGAPQKYSWLLAHGLIVTLVWLYLELLRLIARLRSE
jgi:uncharacterized YccA/Bax inhibitor family protein